MKRKHIDKFYNTTIKSKEFEVFALSLPITLIHKNMFNDTEHFLKTNYDLLHSHIDVLASLYFDGNSLSPTDLYDAIVFSSGGMTKVLKKLEERNLIKREASSNDKRSMLISLTQEGKDLIENCMIEVAKQKEKKFSILTQKEKEDLKNILSKITYSFI
ncbi:MAG: MarR family transcriptional regulator [Aliarcobacter sp.]|jgi:DNA-binding MarR family transcriptional regulator|nr:MarR family transcriptional regulator [Aliarcobacter sp.]MDX9900833.1 MarR family transcriptional regulator [Aliarcobacter sp.]